MRLEQLHDPRRLDFLVDRGLWWPQPMTFIGQDFSDATQITLTVRLTLDAPGDPLIRLQLVTTDAEGVRVMNVSTTTVEAHVTAGRLDNTIYGQTNPATRVPYLPTDSVLVSSLRALANMDGRIPYPQERGDLIELWYDLVIDDPGAPSKKWAWGTLTVLGLAY